MQSACQEVGTSLIVVGVVLQQGLISNYGSCRLKGLSPERPVLIFSRRKTPPADYAAALTRLETVAGNADAGYQHQGMPCIFQYSGSQTQVDLRPIARVTIIECIVQFINETVEGRLFIIARRQGSATQSLLCRSQDSRHGLTVQ